jgi:hypothetical protein
MSTPSGPRLVRPGEASPSPAPAPRPTGSGGGRWLLPVALAAALVAAGAWALEARRAGALEMRVRELSQALRNAEDEIAAQRRHLAEIRGGVAGVRERLDALEAMTAKDPAPPAVEPSESETR